MSRDAMLDRIRKALGRTAGRAVTGLPPALLDSRRIAPPDRPSAFLANAERLGAKPYLAVTESDARDYIAQVLAGRMAIASNAPVLRQSSIVTIPGVQSGVKDKSECRRLCASASAGITGADFALADTGSLVLFSSEEEARMISLLPPIHIALVQRERILSGLDELLTLVPAPCERSSSMVFITGTSRTADIEQILVRGVHGPGEVHVIVL